MLVVAIMNILLRLGGQHKGLTASPETNMGHLLLGDKGLSLGVCAEPAS